MSTGGIVAIVIVGLLTAVFVPIRVAVAKQRRSVEAARARFASVAGKLRRRADAVRIDLVQKIGQSAVHASRTGTCALADDELYCLGDDGRWGARVRIRRSVRPFCRGCSNHDAEGGAEVDRSAPQPAGLNRPAVT